MSVGELVKVVSPPETPAEVGDEDSWRIAEESLGVTLPSDYRRFVARYGSGVIGRFIRIYTPFSSSPHYNLLASVRKDTKILSLAIEDVFALFEEEYPFKLWPEKGGLVPCGTDGNGDYIAWHTKGSPDKWQVVVIAARNVSEYHHFPCTLTTFLAKVLQEKLTCRIWPDNFPSAHRPLMFEPQRPGAKRSKKRSKQSSGTKRPANSETKSRRKR